MSMISAEYDEDHYTLARPTEGYNDNESYSVKTKVNDEANVDSSPSSGRLNCCLRLTKTKISIFIVCTMFFACIVSGVVIYFTLNTKGKLKETFTMKLL